MGSLQLGGALVNILTIYKIAPPTKEASVPSTEEPPSLTESQMVSTIQTTITFRGGRAFVTGFTFFYNTL